MQNLYEAFPEIGNGKLSDAERDPAAQRGLRMMLEEVRPTIVFDVGAHVGDGIMKLRGAGYSGRVVSFEPQPEPFELLSQRADEDEQWTVQNLGIADTPGSMAMNVMRVDLVSSFLKPTSSMSDVVPRAGVATTSVTTTLDNVVPTFIDDSDRVFLHIDVHGYEWKVLGGAQETLKRVLGLKIEMALVPMYEGEKLMPEISSHLYEKGFRLVGLNPVCVDRRGHLLWVHGYFIDSSLL